MIGQKEKKKTKKKYTRGGPSGTLLHSEWTVFATFYTMHNRVNSFPTSLARYFSLVDSFNRKVYIFTRILSSTSNRL